MGIHSRKRISMRTQQVSPGEAMQKIQFLNLSATKALRGWSLICLTTREPLFYARSRIVPASGLEAVFPDQVVTEPRRQSLLCGVSMRGVSAESSVAPGPNGSDHGLESEYQAHVRSLQQYICELLITNQRLRWLLQSRNNDQPKGPADDYEQNA